MKLLGKHPRRRDRHDTAWSPKQRDHGEAQWRRRDPCAQTVRQSELVEVFELSNVLLGHELERDPDLAIQFLASHGL